MNIAGWGPREGVAAWVFGAAGLGADAGLSTAVVYGVLVVVASLPGAGVILVGHVRRHRRHRRDPAGRAEAAGRAEPAGLIPVVPLEPSVGGAEVARA